MDAFKTETIEKNGSSYRVEYFYDDDATPPWDNEDGHGPVSDWVRRDKRPGELVLNSDNRGFSRFYDFAEACRVARRDRWGSRNCEPGMSSRQKAATAARDDFEYLRDWCDDKWFYVGLVVTLLDADGDATEHSAGLWGVEFDAYCELDKDAYLPDLIDELPTLEYITAAA